jgi:hypothetical protein
VPNKRAALDKSGIPMYQPVMSHHGLFNPYAAQLMPTAALQNYMPAITCKLKTTIIDGGGICLCVCLLVHVCGGIIHGDWVFSIGTPVTETLIRMTFDDKYANLLSSSKFAYS